MFVAMSSFKVANGMTAAVKEAFVNRPRLVDTAEGFIRMDVISPHDSPDEFWLITYWTARENYEAWHRSHAYHDSHESIPKGLKLDPSMTRIRFFELVAS